MKRLQIARLLPLLAATALAPTLLIPGPALGQSGFDYATAFSDGLSEPMDIVVVQSGFIVAEKCGKLQYFSTDGSLSELGDIGSDVNCGQPTSGLIGMAVSRAGTDLFVIYTAKVGINHIVARYPLTTDSPPKLNIGSGGPIITGLPAAVTNTRNGAGLAVSGDDTALFVAIGDNSKTQAPLAQDVSKFHGKLLRYNFDGSPSASNPNFPGASTEKSLFAIGIGRPFRISVDPTTGDVFIADSKELKWSELSVAKGGENFGWPEFEGNAHAGPGGATATEPVAPIYEYSDYEGFDSLMIVGEPYRPGPNATSQLPAAFHGAVPVGDFFASWFRMIAPDGTVVLDTNPGISNPRAIVTGHDGALYVVEGGTKTVARLAWNDKSPVVSIDKPGENDRYDSGETLTLEGSANDDEDGPITSGFEWTITLTDKDGGVVNEASETGATATYKLPADIDIEGLLTISLTARDSVGSVGTKTIELRPNATTVTFGTAPDGFEFTVDNQTGTEGFTRVYPAGTPINIGCPVEVDAPETLWVFDFWSGEGEREQTWVVPDEDDVDMICNYRDHLAPPTPVDEGPPNVVEVTPPTADTGSGEDSSDEGCQAAPKGSPGALWLLVGLLGLVALRRRLV